MVTKSDAPSEDTAAPVDEAAVISEDRSVPRIPASHASDDGGLGERAVHALSVVLGVPFPGPEVGGWDLNLVLGLEHLGDDAFSHVVPSLDLLSTLALEGLEGRRGRRRSRSRANFLGSRSRPFIFGRRRLGEQSNGLMEQPDDTKDIGPYGTHVGPYVCLVNT